MTSVVDSPLLFLLSFSERPTWTFYFFCFVLFEFKHDSRLYKGIRVHVCIYLFMCNLMGIVNMVRLLKLLFFIYLVPPVLVGFEYSVSSSCEFMVLESRSFWGIFFLLLLFYFSGIFRFSPLVACWGDTEASEQILIEINFKFLSIYINLFSFFLLSFDPEVILFILCV